MIDPVIKAIHCADAIDLKYDGDPFSFALPFEVSIGPRAEERSDIYSIMAVSSDQVGRERTWPILLLPEWDASLLVSFLEVMVARAGSSGSEKETQTALRRWFYWEYENHSIDREGINTK